MSKILLTVIRNECRRMQSLCNYLSVVDVFINNCSKLGGYCTGAERVLGVSAAGARDTEWKCSCLGTNSNLLGDVLIAIVAGVRPVYRPGVAAAFKLALDNVPVKHCQGVVLVVLVSYNFLYNCLGDAPVINLLEINKESHSNFTNKETDEREDEGDEEALAGHEGPAAGQE